MFQIKAVIEKQEAADYLNSRGIQFELADKFVMCAWEDGCFAGVGAAIIEPDCGEICLIQCDGNLDIFMGKSILNAMDLGGIKTVICKNQACFELMKRMGFQKNDHQIMVLNLEGYFTEKCNHTCN